MKRVDVGESEWVNGGALALCLVAAGIVFVRANHGWRAPFPALAGVLSALPIALLRRWLNRASLAWGDGLLVYHPHGPLWFGERYRLAELRRATERRLTDGEGQLGPTWTLQFERTDGSQFSLGDFRHTDIHALVAQLRTAIAENAR